MKTLSQKEKLLVTSNFFSHLDVSFISTNFPTYLPYVKLFLPNSFNLKDSETCCLRMVYPFPNKPWFLHVCSTSRLKTLWEKEKLLVTSNFSLSVFYLFVQLSAIFIKLKIVVCELFPYGGV